VILSVLLLGLVTAQRLGELVLARRNTRRLLARGAFEAAPGHYPVIVLMHAVWLGGLWLLGWNRPLQPAWVAVFLLLQAGRIWVLATLGERWTTRIIILPGEQLVRRGPYRLISHPNYVVVAGEILVLPLAFGLPLYGLAFSVLNAAVLWVRIRAEHAALSAALKST
jgi:methyltransferase